jgi:C4-dicarboxylate-specific signal transduction histidine kinase
MFALASGLAMLVALGLLVTISWRGLQRLEPFDQHLRQQGALLAASRSIQEVLAAQTADRSEPGAARIRIARARIAALLASGGFADPTTPAHLLAAERSLGAARSATAALADANTHLQRALDVEGLARRRSIAIFHQSARVELGLAITALLVLPATALLVLMMLRERISRPLRDLNHLLALLGEQSLRPAPIAGVAPLLQPVITNYNQLVERLAKALATNKTYQAALESRVRVAAATLLRQRIALAEADRLSAVGEMSARVAHELRNPLAGIQVALANLLQDCGEQDQRERLQLISAEVARMARLLDALLMPARRQAEPRQRVDVHKLISELLDLARYQVPGQIELTNAVEKDLCFCLQPDALRQMLLNLVLNSSHAIGNTPGTIALTGTLAGSHLHICVRDDGPGFPGELLGSGPRPFHSSRSGGSGLGLSTVARMARAMGGRLDLQNLGPAGAMAEIVLPATVKANGHASDT